jgi:hypothetical protein
MEQFTGGLYSGTEVPYPGIDVDRVLGEMDALDRRREVERQRSEAARRAASRRCGPRRSPTARNLETGIHLGVGVPLEGLATVSAVDVPLL